jgi:integrator complex subunit 6
VKFSCSPAEFLNPDPVPYDRYELEPSPLTLYILSRKTPYAVYHVFVSNSYKSNSETCHPFGFLKANASLDRVYLFVLPYNYPVIVPLVQEVVRMNRAGIKPPKEWKINFESYLRNTPAYFIAVSI